MKDYFRKLFYLLPGIKKQLIFLIFFSTIASFLEVFGLGLVGPFLTSIISAEIPDFFIIDLLSPENLNLQNEQLVKVIGLLIIIVFLMRSLIGFLFLKLVVKFAYTQQTRLRIMIVKSFLENDYYSLLQIKFAKILNALTHQSNNFVTNFLTRLIVICSDIIIGLSIVLFLFQINFKITFTIFVIVILFFVVSNLILRKKFEFYGKEFNIMNEKIINWITLFTNNIREIIIYDRKDEFSEGFVNDVNQQQNAIINMNLLQQLPKYLIESFFVTMVILVTFFVMESSTNLNNTITLFAIFVAASIRILPITFNIYNSLGNIWNSRHTVTRLYELVLVLNQKKKKFANKIDYKIDSFELINVDFAYPDTNEKILSNINLSLKKGDFIFLNGESGSGKTTLVNIICGFLKIKSGSKLINGKKIDDNIDYFRRINYIPQNAATINNTLEKNILFSNFGNLNNDEFRSYLKSVNLEIFLDKKSYVINSNANNISGGQKQRLLLCRVLFFDRDIIILDEASSAIDELNEERIYSNFKKIFIEKIVIVISHRKNLKKFSNKVLLLKNKELIIE